MNEKKQTNFHLIDSDDNLICWKKNPWINKSVTIFIEQLYSCLYVTRVY